MTQALAKIDADIVVGDALHQLQRAEIDTQISTAKKYRRDVGQFLADARDMVGIDEETAAACSYNLRRGGNSIQGPSVRLAEIAASCWGNLRYGSRVVDITDTHVIAQGFCHDLQRNVAYSTEVMRKITDRRGQRYSDDMITVTANAACAIAGRNAIFKVIPGAYINQISAAAMDVVAGEEVPLEEQRQNVVNRLQTAYGIDKDRVLAVIGCASVESITRDDVRELISLGSAIKDGAITADEAFPKPKAKNADELAEQVKAKVERSMGTEAKVIDVVATPAEKKPGKR